MRFRYIYDWAKEWQGAIFLSCALIFFELACLALALYRTPKGYSWLGDLIFNATDYPVYLNYLGQAKSSFLVLNLYRVAPQSPYLEPFWSILGQLTKLGLEPIWIHEISRWVATAILAFVVYWIAKNITDKKRHAIYASFAMVCGMGSGWLFAFLFNIIHGYILVPLPTDIATEFSVVTSLSGGSHMILSVALQIFSAFTLWEILAENKSRYLKYAIPAIFALACFHTYYIPLIGLISVSSLLFGLREGSQRKKKILYFLLINASQIPGAAYFTWLSFSDKYIGDQYLKVNQLPLSSYGLWLLGLIPLAIAAATLLIKKEWFFEFKTKTPGWAWTWIASAIACMLLPFPWTQKYTQGLLLAAIVITMPFWLWVMEKVFFQSQKFWLQIALITFMSGPFMYFLFLYTQLNTPELKDLFYRPQAVIDAWSYIEKHSAKYEITLMDNERLNLWSPAYTLRRTWLGHAHATPGYRSNLEELNVWRGVQDKTIFNSFLDEKGIDWLMATNFETRQRYSALLSDRWQEIKNEDGVSLWRKSE